MKYTKELLEPLVKESKSVLSVCKKLNLKLGGGTMCHIKNKIVKFNIDISHFTGKGSNFGMNHTGGSTKKSWKEILTKKTSGVRTKPFLLRRALIESGRDYKCETCNIENWNKEPITLQVNHKDGNWLDDRKDNLEFLCPNCHSQTPNWSGNKGNSELTTRAKYFREYRKRNAVIPQLAEGAS